MDMILLLTAMIGLVTAVVGLVTAVVTVVPTYRDLCSRKEKNPSPSQPGKDSNKHP